jgi:isoquinoline 1-oxidoreductase beta subunit
VHRAQVLDTPKTIDPPKERKLPLLAPAFANAIFGLTGKRLRKVPFDLASA